MNKFKLKRIHSVLMYGGTNKSIYDKLRPEIKDSNYKCDVASLFVTSMAFIALAILSYMKVSPATVANRSIYTFSAIVLLTLLFVVLKWGKTVSYVPQFVASGFVLCMFLIGIYMATVTGANEMTVSYNVFMLAIPLVFTLPPITIIVMLTISQALYFVTITHVQTGALLANNIIVVLIYGGISYILVSFMMCIKIGRFVAVYENKKLTETDIMTGLLNRRSYENRLEELRNKPEKVSVVVYDINGLKTTNDNKGHMAGDELIMASANCISQIFNDKGKHDTYRIGGDEFVSILNCDEKETVLLLCHVDELTAKWKGVYNEGLNISYGVASNYENESLSINELIISAEKLMYEDKDEFYKNSSIERRIQ